MLDEFSVAVTAILLLVPVLKVTWRQKTGTSFSWDDNYKVKTAKAVWVMQSGMFIFEFITFKPYTHFRILGKSGINVCCIYKGLLRIQLWMIVNQSLLPSRQHSYFVL